LEDKVAIQTRFIGENKYIEILYSGNVSNDELIDAVLKAKVLSEENGTNVFLADCSNMSGGHSIIDLYNLILLYEQLGLSRTLREAILLPAMPDTIENVRFYETASLNRGYTVRLFENREEALGWLLTESK
jgi:hypothetical protein